MRGSSASTNADKHRGGAYGLLVLVLAVAGLLALAAAGSAPLLAQAAGGGAQVQSLLDDAASARDFAAQRREQGAKWRQREEQARERAGRAATSEDRESWRRDAEDYAERAQAAEDDAAAAEARAAEAEAEAARLGVAAGESAPPPPPEDTASAEPPAERRPVEVQDVFGTWRLGEGNAPFVIVPQDPGFRAYLHRLEAHTAERVWTGEFEPFDEGDIRRYWDARLTFNYTPTAEEMNPEVPLWARQAVAGELEWRLEFNEAGTCGTPKFDGQWWPGEITWREQEEGDAPEGARTAWVSGKGDPIPLNLSPANDLHIEPNPSPFVVIRLPNGPDPISEPVSALVKGQLFFPEVRIPQSLAEHVGESVAVTLTGMPGGDTDEIRLPRAGINEYGLVVYTVGPVAIGDTWHEASVGGDFDPLPFSTSAAIQWFTGRRGALLDLSVETGDTVAVTYGSVGTSFTMYDTWVQRGLDRHGEAMEQLRALHLSSLLDPELTREEKESAHRRLLMVRNLSAMLENEHLHDYQKYRLSELYLGRVVEKGSFGGRGTAGGLLNIPIDSLLWQVDFAGHVTSRGISEYFQVGERHRSGWFDGVVWTSAFEMYGAEAVANHARDEKRAQAISEIPLAFAYTAYDIVVNFSGGVFGVDVGDVRCLITGEDHFGKKVHRAWCLAGALMGQAFKGYKGLLKKLIRYDQLPRRFARGATTGQPAVKAVAQPAVRPPDTVPEAAVRKLRELGGDSVPGRGASEICAAPPSIETFDLDLGNSLMRRAQLESDAQALYGSNGRVLEDLATPSRPPQQFGTCNLEATGSIVKKQTGVDKSEIRNLIDLARSGAVDPRRLVSVRNPQTGEVEQKHLLNYGFFDEAAEALARLRGADTVVSTLDVPHVRNLTLEDVGTLLDAGFGVKATIRWRGSQQAKHAVDIDGFVRNARGEITEVEFTDHAVKARLSVPACEFNTRLAAGRDPDGVNAFQFFKWPDRLRPTIEPPRQTASPPRSQPTVGRAVGETPPAASADASRPSYLPGLNKTLWQVLDEEFPDATTMPPLHVTDIKGLRGMMDDGYFRITGGAQFSYRSGLGLYERGPVAIRVRPGHEDFVELSPSNEARGLIPHWWPQGQGRGTRNESRIPTEHLQWFNPHRPQGERWVDFAG